MYNKCICSFIATRGLTIVHKDLDICSSMTELLNACLNGVNERTDGKSMIDGKYISFIRLYFVVTNNLSIFQLRIRKSIFYVKK